MASMLCWAAALLAIAAALTLQGCGGSGGGGGGTGGATTTMTTTRPPKSAPLDGHTVAGMLNKLYHGFRSDDPSSPLGVYVTMQSEWFMYCGTPCFEGRADCRLSTALYNDKMLLTWQKYMRVFGDRPAGYVVSHTIVESQIGKCAYMFDGASEHRVNNGCGRGGGSNDCKDPHSAYGDVCPSTNKTCTANDVEVSAASCDNSPIMNWTGQTQCYWSGPALDYPRESKNEFRQMVTNRMYNQGKPGDPVTDPSGHSRLAYWNEVVVDLRAMEKALEWDPAPVVPAFLYKLGDPQGIPTATAIRDQFNKRYDVPGTIPLVGMNLTQDVWAGFDGPFFFDEKAQVSIEQVVI